MCDLYASLRATTFFSLALTTSAASSPTWTSPRNSIFGITDVRCQLQVILCEIRKNFLKRPTKEKEKQTHFKQSIQSLTYLPTLKNNNKQWLNIWVIKKPWNF